MRIIYPPVNGYIKEWYDTTQDTLGRCFASAEFRYAFPKLNRELKGIKPSQNKNKQIKTFLSTLEKPLKGTTRDAAYQTVKFFNSSFKFKPYGAIKLARNVGKFGAAIGVIGLTGRQYSLKSLFNKECSVLW